LQLPHAIFFLEDDAKGMLRRFLRTPVPSSLDAQTRTLPEASRAIGGKEFHEYGTLPILTAFLRMRVKSALFAEEIRGIERERERWQCLQCEYHGVAIGSVGHHFGVHFVIGEHRRPRIISAPVNWKPSPSLQHDPFRKNEGDDL